MIGNERFIQGICFGKSLFIISTTLRIFVIALQQSVFYSYFRFIFILNEYQKSHEYEKCIFEDTTSVCTIEFCLATQRL